MRRIALVAAVAFVLMPAAAAHALATSTLSVQHASMFDDGGPDTFVITASGGLLAHNRFSAHDQNYNSDFDWDTTQVGDQTVPNNHFSTITIAGNDGNDVLRVGSPTLLAANILANIEWQGGADTDSATIDDSADSVGRTFGIGDTTFGVASASITTATNESLSVMGGSGPDQISASFPVTGIQTAIDGGPGGDTITVPAALFAPLSVEGGADSDSLGVLGVGAGTTTVDVQQNALVTTGFPAIAYSGLESLTYNGADGGDAVTVSATAAGTATQVDGGVGDDSITVDYAGVHSPLSFAGGNGINTAAVTTTSAGAAALTPTTFTRATSPPFAYGGLSELDLNFGDAADDLTVADTGAPTLIDMGGGNDSVRIPAAPAKAASVNGAADGDSIVFDDSAATTGHGYGVSSARVFRDGALSNVFSNAESLSLLTGSGVDSIVKRGAMPFTIDAGGGDDAVATADTVADTVACGDGADFALTDALDTIAGCEHGDRNPLAPIIVSGGTTTPTTTPTTTTTPQTQPAPVDKTAPKFTIAGLPKNPTVRQLVKGITITLTPDEASSFEIAELATAKRPALARAGDVTLAEATVARASGQRKLKLKASKRLVGKAKKLTVRIVVTAVDAAGNRSTTTRTLKAKKR